MNKGACGVKVIIYPAVIDLSMHKIRFQCQYTLI